MNRPGGLASPLLLMLLLMMLLLLGVIRVLPGVTELFPVAINLQQFGLEVSSVQGLVQSDSFICDDCLGIEYPVHD